MTPEVRNIWLYSDPDVQMKEACQLAVQAAVHHDAILTILSIVETDGPTAVQTSVDRDIARIIREDREHRLQALVEEAREVLPADRVAHALHEGEVAWHTLTAHAVRVHPDLVIVPADGERDAATFGRLSMHLFRNCPTPVLSVQAGTGGFPKRALVAVNSGPPGSDDRALSHEVLRAAVDFAAGSGMELHLAHAWHMVGEKLIASKFGAGEAQAHLDSLLRQTQDYTEELLRQTESGERFRAKHYPKGEPGQVIPRLADKLGADVIILGSAARRGLEGFLVGSVAETILGATRVSALVVKPPSFSSPVRARWRAR